MKSAYLPGLLAVFVIHLIIFLRIALRTHYGYHRCLVLTFLCLIVMTGLRLWAPTLSLGSTHLWQLFRWGAWAFTVLAGVLWWHQRRQLKVGGDRN